MIDTLNETLRAKGLQQGSAVQSIQQAYDRSEAIFNELAG